MTFKSGHLEFEENYNRVLDPAYGLKRLNNPAPIRYVTGLLTGFLCINLPRVAGFRRARACRSNINQPVPEIRNPKFDENTILTQTWSEFHCLRGFSLGGMSRRDVQKWSLRYFSEIIAEYMPSYYKL